MAEKVQKSWQTLNSTFAKAKPYLSQENKDHILGDIIRIISDHDYGEWKKPHKVFTPEITQMFIREILTNLSPLEIQIAERIKNLSGVKRVSSRRHNGAYEVWVFAGAYDEAVELSVYQFEDEYWKLTKKSINIVFLWEGYYDEAGLPDFDMTVKK